MTTRSTPRKNTTLYEEKFTASKELYYETYEIGKSLGKGGFAQVYELFSKGGTQLNAVKIISKLDKQNKQDPIYLEKVPLPPPRSVLKSRSCKSPPSPPTTSSATSTTSAIVNICTS